MMRAEAIPVCVPLDEVADRIGVQAAELRRLSRAGKFPRLFRVNRTSWTVRVDEVQRWLDDVEESPAKSRLQSEILRRAARAAS